MLYVFQIFYAHEILDLCFHKGNLNISGTIPTEIGLITSLEYFFTGEFGVVCINVAFCDECFPAVSYCHLTLRNIMTCA